MPEHPPPQDDDLRLPERLLTGLQRLTILLWLYLAVSTTLRFVWLARPDPFGQPLVGKVDWYLFHAVGLDLQQAGWLALLPLLVLLAGGGRLLPVRLAGGLLIFECVAATLLALVDEESMRFGGNHLSIQMVRTYGNGAAISELPRLLAHDAGGPYVNVALLVTAIPGLAWLQIHVLRRPLVRLQVGRARLPRSTIAFALAILAGWLFTTVLWPGVAREWRLLPPLTLLRDEWARADHHDLTPAEVAQAQAAHRARWQRQELGNPSVFVLPTHPLVHLTPHAACVAIAAGHLAGPQALDCTADSDRDGSTLAQDCDDLRPDVHPGANDLPGDGVDQDCSGVDARPWNVLLLALESHRSLSVGHVTGGQTWTPHLDRLATQGLAQGRAVANGLPTIASFMAIHTSLPPCPHCTVATQFTADTLPSLPEKLRQQGYYTRFFSAGDPSWDNQRAWLRHWYDATDYHRSREEDAPLFEHMADWFAHDLAKTAQGKPFFVMAMTRTNHFPFPRVAGVAKTGGDTIAECMRDTMGYTDAAMAKLLTELAKQPWFEHTIVVITGDHGYPLGEHGAFQLYQTAHVEATGVPIVFLGDHPALRAKRGQVEQTPASHMDLAPTILDLLGLDGSGAWMGRSLVRPGQGESLTVTGAEWAIERGKWRLLVKDDRPLDPESWQLFDRLADPRELKPLSDPIAAKQLAEDLTWMARWLGDLYAADRIAPAWLR